MKIFLYTFLFIYQWCHWMCKCSEWCCYQHNYCHYCTVVNAIPRFAVAQFSLLLRLTAATKCALLEQEQNSCCFPVILFPCKSDNHRGSLAAGDCSTGGCLGSGLPVPWLSSQGISEALRLPAQSWRMLMTFSSFTGALPSLGSPGSALTHLPAHKPWHSILGGPGLCLGLALILLSS